MNNFLNETYKKSELQFALIWIGIYVVSNSVANTLSDIVGIIYSVNIVVNVILTVIMLGWIKKNGLNEKYGLCKSNIPASRFLWYIPLILFMSHNLWNGFAINASTADIICHMASMLFVGILEEVIFRGFLFRALEKDNLKTAIIISSVTFGLGHVINLLNGSGMELIDNLFQVSMAIAVGFCFVVLFYRGKSIWPCIIAHSLNNMVSIFANDVMTIETRLMYSGLNIIILIAYTLILLKTLPKVNEEV